MEMWTEAICQEKQPLAVSLNRTCQPRMHLIYNDILGQGWADLHEPFWGGSPVEHQHPIHATLKVG
eukprot:802594-Pelagomonas_calceolata.AAC.3